MNTAIITSVCNQINKAQANPMTLEIQNWLLNYLSSFLSVSASEIDVNLNLHSYGLDSVVAIGMVADLSEEIGYELPPEILFDYPTITALADYCSNIEEVVL